MPTGAKNNHKINWLSNKYTIIASKDVERNMPYGSAKFKLFNMWVTMVNGRSELELEKPSKPE